MQATMERNELPKDLFTTRLLNIYQLAEYLSVSREAIYRMMNNSENPLPSFCLPKRHRRFRLDQVMEWMENQKKDLNEPKS